MTNENKAEAPPIPGRTKYRPELDDLLREHLSAGLSFQAFAGVAKVNQATLYDWLKRHPSFAEAKEESTEEGRLYYEKMGHNAVLGKIPNFNTTAWIFTMKNRFGWRDRQEVKNLGEGEEFGEVITHDKIMAYIDGKKF